MANDPRCPSETSLRYSVRICSFVSRRSSATDMNHSDTFRFSVCSGVKNVFFTSCWVTVLPLRRYSSPNTLSIAALDDADRIDARVIVEPAILDREHRLNHDRRDRPRAEHRGVFLSLGDERGDERRIEREFLGASSSSGRLEWSMPTGPAPGPRARLRHASSRPATNTMRTSCPLRSPSRGIITMASRPIGEFAGLLRPRRRNSRGR